MSIGKLLDASEKSTSEKNMQGVLFCRWYVGLSCSLVFAACKNEMLLCVMYTAVARWSIVDSWHAEKPADNNECCCQASSRSVL